MEKYAPAPKLPLERTNNNEGPAQASKSPLEREGQNPGNYSWFLSPTNLFQTCPTQPKTRIQGFKDPPVGKGALKDCNWTKILQDQRSNHMGIGSFQYALLIVTQQEQCVSVAKVLNTQTVLLLRHVGLNLPSEPEGPKLTDWTKPSLDNIFTTNSSIPGWCNVNPIEAYPSKVRFKEKCDCKYVFVEAIL
ncbi:hypothetical protein HYC85_015238 [Camellia sinensis]|uniref:Uncharacterized protein n=1 Tax=Camellia sinensis TaxID=4442 RepID=A0A7J7GWI8_CAMSI|nr:hypothetical protein HYC85_015238 [Camellia sinensis]